MKWSKLSASMVLPVAMLVFHPLGCSVLYTCEDDGTCAEVPEGWTGYHFLHEVDDARAAAERCGDGAEPTSYFMHPPPQGPQKCRACACDPLDVQKGCPLPKLECWDGSRCDAGIKLKTNVSVERCELSYWNEDSNGVPFDELSGNARCRISEAAPPEINAIEVKAIDLPTWGGRLDLCDAASSTATDLICIQAPGHGRACPSGWDHSLEAYTTGADSRTCSACSCEARCDGGGYTFSDYCYQAEPAGKLKDVDATGACLSVSYSWPSYGIKPRQPQLSTQAKGGELRGTLEPQGPVTFCCRPAE
ncbi:hypothetical protein [Polyangium mundeleinium]|uniref:Uncharacterized protein n=1 Tax=Polyangium mundeleinium TaxID=2995306 RepID=A0ABT5ESM5_9BACT|nr:hypothetical protein [Polyangium mundeleinium]MDC0744756.1 hypothetical protein [Polyangium mundeleinium]